MVSRLCSWVNLYKGKKYDVILILVNIADDNVRKGSVMKRVEADVICKDCNVLVNLCANNPST